MLTNLPRDAVKLLTIGNSFSNNATEYLPEIVATAGKKLILFRANVGGKALGYHARHLAIALANPKAPQGRPYKNNPAVLPDCHRNKASLPEALAALDWDFVTLQQGSPYSYKPATFEPHASELIAAIRKFARNAEILVHQTWAWREDSERFKKKLTQQVMFTRLRAAYADLAARNGGLRILPSGAAMQAARATPRWTYRPDPDYDFQNPPLDALPQQPGSLNVGWRWVQSGEQPRLALDYKHANTAGKYLTACVWFEMLYGTDCDKAAAFTPEGLAIEDAADLRHIAHSVVSRQAV